MAEVVQLRIERTVPELEQMERIGLFNNSEVKQIIRQRKAREYRLQRRMKTKEDYLKLIEYENCLLTLIKKRREKTQNFNKKNEIDHSIALRISKLYKAVIVRYQKDVDLWLSHIEFCKKVHWNHTISGMFVRLLQVHNKTPALWVMAAKWEMEENSAPDNSRGHFQRGLRFHPESKHLWLEYFRMELMYTDQIRKRREALQLDQPEDKDEAVFQGKIAMIVFKNAVAAIPDVNFIISFIPICHHFDFSKPHEDEIYNLLREQYADKEETWDALAKRSLKELQDTEWKKPRNSESKIPNLKEKVFSYYEEAIEIIPTVKMWSFYIQMCLDLIQRMDQANVTQIVLYVLNLMERAANKDCLSENLHQEWIKLLNSCEKSEESMSAACLLVQKWPTVVSHWLLCISIHIENKSPVKTIMPLFNRSIYSVPEKESLPLWQLGVEWLSSAKPEKLQDLFEHGINMHEVVSVPMKSAYLSYIEERDGLKGCRNLYNRLKKLKPLSVEFFQKMIEIEYSHHKNPQISRMRRIYEEALLEFGKSAVDLWLNYIKLELTHKEGHPTAIGNIYWRAVKLLEEDKTDLFISKYTLLTKEKKPQLEDR